jgi:sugar O-acyltransferase (sialic acid O-acetyltransferase NeuD family)
VANVKEAGTMKKSEDHIVVIGASGHAKVVIDVIEKEGRYQIAGLIDSLKPAGEKVCGYEILGAEDKLAALVASGDIQGGLIAIGDNWKRYLVSEKVKSMMPGFNFISSLHPSVQIGSGVSIGDGSVLMAGAIVNSDSRIGRFCILNTKSSLDHDGVMEDFSSLAPNATTGGKVTIGGFSAVSLGASIIQGVRIGEHSVLGAGSLAVDDIPHHSVAYGTPAKVIRKRLEGDKYL